MFIEKSVSCLQISSKINWRDKLFQKSKKVVKVGASTFRLNQKRSNTYNQSIENKMVTQNILVNSKMRF